MFTVWQEAVSRSPVRVLTGVKGGKQEMCGRVREEENVRTDGEIGFERVMR